MDTELKRISVIGLGKLGAPLAACFAWKGFPTIGVDLDPSKVKAVNRGVAPIYEPGLQELLSASQGRLIATEDYEEAIMNSDVSFIVVPTPSDDRGAFSLRYVLEAARHIGDALRKKDAYHLVVVTSTVMPGATEGEVKPVLEIRSGKRCGFDFGLCYSPEFIALGSVIHDFLNPDFILIGESDSRSGEMLAHLYKCVCQNDPPVARMNFVNAELTKLAVNSYVTTKISFANMLARICERLPGADVDVVTAALGLDSRIGRRYLKGAIGYGGPCFPRDNIALATLARSLGAPAILAETTDKFNRQQVEWLAALVKSRLSEGGRVGILGLAYKPNSDVVEESQGLLLARALVERGVGVIAYDPVAMENARKALQTARVVERSDQSDVFFDRRSSAEIIFASSAEECVAQSDVVVVTTAWEEFKRLTPTQFMRHSPPRVVIDCWRLFQGMEQRDGVTYLPLGVWNLCDR